ncbi:MAG: type II toxin-antitoxin system HicB family antitoxin [Waterburya sp.]
MKTIIKLKIERFEEQGQEYFVATSDDLQGLVAEGNTVEEAVAIAEDLAHHLLELDRKQENITAKFQIMPQQFEYPLIIEV